MANWFRKWNEMATTSHQGRISLAMAFGMKWSSVKHNLTEGFTVFKTEGYLTHAYLFCTLPSIKVWSRKLTVLTIFEQKRKRVLVMLRVDSGPTLERPWSSPAREEGWNVEMVEEADGECNVLLCEGWISQGGVEEGWEMGKKRGRMQDYD